MIRDGVVITYDALGTKYSCPICGWFPNRIECHIKGWGKAQHLKKMVRDHIKQAHGEQQKASA